MYSNGILQVKHVYHIQERVGKYSLMQKNQLMGNKKIILTKMLFLFLNTIKTPQAKQLKLTKYAICGEMTVKRGNHK